MKKNKLAAHYKPGFKVPNNYFGDFDAKMMHVISKEQIFGEQAIGKPGFSVPKNYFDSLENQISAKIEHPEPRGMIISLFRKNKLYAASGIAAVFIGIISSLLLRPNSLNSLNSVELSALEEYIDEENIDFNFNEISTFIYEEGYVMDNLNISGVSDEAVFDYLSDHGEDPALILY